MERTSSADRKGGAIGTGDGWGDRGRIHGKGEGLGGVGKCPIRCGKGDGEAAAGGWCAAQRSSRGGEGDTSRECTGLTEGRGRGSRGCNLERASRAPGEGGADFAL